MDNIIMLENINFMYGEKTIFEDFSINIKKGTFLSIIGNNGSGKTTLLKILLGLIKTSGKITINNLEMSKSNIKEIVKKIGVVFENAEDSFVAETVMHDIAFPLENLNISPKEIKKRISFISKKLEIEDLLEREPHSLSGGERQLVALAEALVIEPEILILDEAFSMLDNDMRNKVYNYLIELNEKNNLTIINVTHEIEETLYCKEILLLNDGKQILYGSKEEVYQEEKIFSKLGIKLPFMAELSIKLKYYNLVDHLIFDMQEMVNELWK